MKMLRFLRRELLQAILLLLPFALAAAWWDKIPPVVATHWNLHGQPNSWMPKAPGLLLAPAINVALCLLLAFLPRIDPRLSRDPAADSTRYRRVLRVYRYSVTTLLAVVAVAVIAIAAGWRIDMGGLAFNGGLALMAVAGNFMGNLPPNYFVGCRTPWTLQDGDTWRATHRTTGRLLFFGAVALLAVQFFVSREVQGYSFMAYVLGITAWSLGYSAWFFQRRRMA